MRLPGAKFIEGYIHFSQRWSVHFLFISGSLTPTALQANIIQGSGSDNKQMEIILLNDYSFS